MFDNEQYLTSAELARLFGLTSRRIQQLTEDGILKPELDSKKRRKYSLTDNIKYYISYLSDKAHGRDEKEKDTNQLVIKKLEADVRIKEAKAQMAELELAELEGKMHRAEDVEDMTADLCLNIRSNLLALPLYTAAKCATGRSSIKMPTWITIVSPSCLICSCLSLVLWCSMPHSATVCSVFGAVI